MHTDIWCKQQEQLRATHFHTHLLCISSGVLGAVVQKGPVWSDRACHQRTSRPWRGEWTKRSEAASQFTETSVNKRALLFVPAGRPSEANLSTVSLDSWTPDISSSLARSELTSRWLTNPVTLAWYVAVVITSAPLRRNLSIHHIKNLSYHLWASEAGNRRLSALLLEKWQTII